jgi:alpha-mannosidase
MTGVSYQGLNRLVDEGDAGDEYNFSPVEAGVLVDQPEVPASVRVVENGPLRAALEIDLLYNVPSGLIGDRLRRASVGVRMPVTIRVSLAAGSPQLDFEVRLENLATDHRLRAHIPLPFAATHSDADTAFHVTRRPVRRARHEPGAPEWELPSYPMRNFVDASDGSRGVALITQGLHEYEVLPGPPSVLALTLLRAVGWLSRDDLAYRTGHAGPALETPGAQVLGHHLFRYGVRFHDGGWEAASLWRAAESTSLPMLVLPPGAPREPGRSIELEPDSLQMSALIPRDDGFDLRLLNASASSRDGVVHIRPLPRSISWISLAGELKERLTEDEGAYRIKLKAWEIVTLRVQR